MSTMRTQIYLTAEQRARIDRVARARGVTMAEVIRTALDQFLDSAPDPTTALASTFGADKEVSVPSRDEWDRG
jgi:hypothetical protein